MEYEQKEYASKGVAGAGLGLGIAGTAIGLLAAHGGSWFGNNNAQSDEVCQLRMQNAILSSENSTDKKLVDVYTTLRVADKAQDEKMSDLSSRVLALETSAPLREQIIMGQVQNVATSVVNVNNTLQSEINCIQNTLSGITKTVVPNSSVCPGWGNVTITPAASTTNG